MEEASLFWHRWRIFFYLIILWQLKKKLFIIYPEILWSKSYKNIKSQLYTCKLLKVEGYQENKHQGMQQYGIMVFNRGPDTWVPMIVVACQGQPPMTTSALNKKLKNLHGIINLTDYGEDHREVIMGLMFVCFFSPMLLLLLFFLFPTCDCLNAKGEENLPQTAQHNPCTTLQCNWYIYLSQKIQK